MKSLGKRFQLPGQPAPFPGVMPEVVAAALMSLAVCSEGASAEHSPAAAKFEDIKIHAALHYKNTIDVNS